MPIPGAPVSSGKPAAVGNTVNVGNLAIAVLQLEGRRRRCAEGIWRLLADAFGPTPARLDNLAGEFGGAYSR